MDENGRHCGDRVLDRTGLEDPVLGTEVDRHLPGAGNDALLLLLLCTRCVSTGDIGGDCGDGPTDHAPRPAAQDYAQQ